MMSRQPYTTDTTADAMAVQLEGFRRMSPTERVNKMRKWSASLRQMAMNAIRRRHPEMGESDVRLKFIELTYGKELAESVRTHLRDRECV